MEGESTVGDEGIMVCLACRNRDYYDTPNDSASSMLPDNDTIMPCKGDLRQ